MRKKIVAGNWKLNKNRSEAKQLIDGLVKSTANIKNAEMVICPTFTSLETALNALAGSKILLGAQDCYHEASGAYTGEISPEMLKDAGCVYCIIGHSERRQYFGETDASINKKAFGLYRAGIKPIICIGETKDDRLAERTNAVLGNQLRGCLKDIPADKMKETVIAYEPVWAIGTGLTASEEQVQAAHSFIRSLVIELFGKEVADVVRIQYGGSVKPDNAKKIFSLPDVDGGLIGGASLKVDDFKAIIEAAE